MKVKTPSATKRLALSLGIGIAFVLVLFSVSGASTKSPFFFLLRPGAFLADWAAFGAHDTEGLLLFIIGNVAFYVVIAFVGLSLG